MPVKNLELQRRLTREFIQMNPIDIVVVPVWEIETASGGKTFESPLPEGIPCTVTIIEPAGDPTPTAAQDGISRNEVFEVLAEWGAPIGRNSYFYHQFYHQNKKWTVTDVWYDNEYELRALVTARG